MDVSVIFVNYKTKDLTINAIKSVYEKTEGVNIEIIIVDNNSNDGSVEAIKKAFPQIKIIENIANTGFGSANNLGIKASKGKYIFCLNTDTLLLNNAIKIMFDFMEKEENQKVAVCGGYLYDGNKKPCCCGGKFPSVTEIFFKFGIRQLFPNLYKKCKLVFNSDELLQNSEIDYVTGANVFFRKSILDEVGLFDEQFFMYYEETDLCKRIKNAGYKVKFVSDSKIIHLEQKSIGQTLNRKLIAKKSEMLYFSKHQKNTIPLIKVLYSILYFIDAFFLRNKDSLEIQKLIWEYKLEEI